MDLSVNLNSGIHCSTRTSQRIYRRSLLFLGAGFGLRRSNVGALQAYAGEAIVRGHGYSEEEEAACVTKASRHHLLQANIEPCNIIKELDLVM